MGSNLDTSRWCISLKPQGGVLTSAQGNALGKRFIKDQALKGRHNLRDIRAPFQGLASLGFYSQVVVALG